MNSDINLLITNDESKLEEKRRVAIFRKISLVLLGIVCLFSLSLFVLKLQLGELKLARNQTDALNNLKALNKRGVKLFLINTRLSDIENILNTRVRVVPILDLVTQNLLNDSQVDDLVVDKKNLTLTISSSSLLTMNNFIDQLTIDSQNKKILSSITLDNLVLNDQKNKYSVTLKAIIQ